MPAAKKAEHPTQQKEQTPSTPLDGLIARLDAIEERLVQVESMAHSGHSLGPEAVNYIAGVAVEQVKTEVLHPLGMSGFPAKG